MVGRGDVRAGGGSGSDAEDGRRGSAWLGGRSGWL